MTAETKLFPAFSKSIYIGTMPSYDSRRERVTVNIRWDDREGGRLSITGETQRPWKNDVESCGQIIGALSEVDGFSDGYSLQTVRRLANIWRMYHLNDMQAACEHQRARGETWSTHPLAHCPECDYKLGTKWLHMDVPRDVLKWLDMLPEN